MNPKTIRTAEPFESMFPIDSSTLNDIAADMKARGYDPAHPVVIWKEQKVLVCGHTRLMAAASLKDIPALHKSFPDEDAAIDYAIRDQKLRRNLTDAELLGCIAAVDKRRKAGRPAEDDGEELAPDGANKGSKSAKDTARRVGVSPRSVERARAVIDHADPATKDAVKQGDMSLGAAYEDVMQTRRAAKERKQTKPTFNRTNDNIEWAKWTWNPVTGCKHGCRYCYARDIATRFDGHFKPAFHENRLAAPKNTKRPTPKDIGFKNVFVCSMADLFGDWVPQEWIDAVLGAVREAPDWNFLFLTKNPKRLVDIGWPGNAWVGTTVDTQARVTPALEAFKKMASRKNRPPVLFLSCEPLLEELNFGAGLKAFDWVIIGGCSRTSKAEAKQPAWLWAESLLRQSREAGCKVYFKPNLTARPTEYPAA